MKKILFLLAVSLFAFQLTCFASITVSGNTGIIKIIPPGGGAPITVMPGQPIPPIPNGATIQIVTGDATVATTAPSTVNLSSNGNTIALGPGGTVRVSLNTNGAVKVTDLDGTASVTSNGRTTSLPPGTTIVLAGNGVKNAEAYQPPVNNPGAGVNTQVRIEEGAPDISPNGR